MAVVVKRMPSFIDLTGMRFGRLVVASVALTKNKRTMWNVVCDCGSQATVTAGNLRRAGGTLSCGCLQKEANIKRCRTHGRSKSPEMRLYWLAKQRAKKKCISFDISPEDIVIPTSCPILGVPLKTSGERESWTASVDRIIPSLGYVKGNVWVISFRANAIKNDATVDELVAIVEAVRKKCVI